MKVLIETLIGKQRGTQICPLEDGHLTYCSVPASVQYQIEEAIYQKQQFSGVATYESRDSKDIPYKYEFKWRLDI